MRRINKALLGIVFSMLLAGCSGSPSNSEIKTAIHDSVSMMTLGIVAEDIDIEHLKVANGKMLEKDKFAADVSFDMAVSRGGQKQVRHYAQRLVFIRSDDGWAIIKMK